jgi:hypothetical protein
MESLELWTDSMILLNRIFRYYSKYQPKYPLHHKYGLAFLEAIGNDICKTFLLININVCMIKKKKLENYESTKHE